MKCRSCFQAPLLPFLDLGRAPHSNGYLSSQQLSACEKKYPLKLYVCQTCWLAQTSEKIDERELFTPDYAYFSSTSSSWLSHAKSYVEMITTHLSLNSSSFVLEVASNDGYLLQYFVERGIPCLGIEPTTCTANAARQKGVPTKEAFFTQKLARELASEGKKADLILGNNVLAHVPDLHDFVGALALCLKENGTITLEFPHLLCLLSAVQFDTVYHEHYSYFSLYTVQRLLAEHGLKLYRIEQLTTHGGSLRLFATHQSSSRVVEPSVDEMIACEKGWGLQEPSVYQAFQSKCDAIRDDLIAFLEQMRKEGKRVGAYGAAAKGNTILNYAEIGPDLLPYVCDAAPSKQGKFLPGSHIPILPPNEIAKRRPDFLVILPWNLADEIVDQHHYIREWGGKFVTFIPRREIV